MNKPKIALVAYEGETVPEWVCKEFAEAGAEFVYNDCATTDEMLQYAADADVVWVRSGIKIITPESLDRLEQCGAIIRSGTGTDNIPVAEATSRGIIVANTPKAAGRAVAEHAVGLMLAVARAIVLQDRNVRQGIWDRNAGWPDWHLSENTLGLVSFGYIAQYVARMVRGFEMNVLAFDPYIDERVMNECGVRKVSLDELMTGSDFVSIHTPMMDETYHMIGEDQLRLMKEHAVLINTSRGGIVDTDALVRALSEGWIAGAGLDVHEQAPLDTEHPLLQMKNVVVTPHIASYSDQFLFNFWRHSVDTAIDLINRHWPRDYVNREVQPHWEMVERGKTPHPSGG